MMLVFADHIMGSIGGGALEYKAIETARAHRLEAGFERQTRSYPLGPSLGQCCGGQVRLMYEWYNPATLPAQPALAELAAQKDGYSLHDTASQNVPDHLPSSRMMIYPRARVCCLCRNRVVMSSSMGPGMSAGLLSSWPAICAAGFTGLMLMMAATLRPSRRQ